MAVSVFAAPKRDWREGRVVKVDSVDIVEGTNAQRFYYTIDTGSSLLIVTDKLVWRWTKPTVVLEGDIVKWSMHKQQVFMIGPDGIEHTLTLRRQDVKAR